MLVVITGKPGSGKTTLVREIVGILKDPVGFLTEEVRRDGKRVGFNVVTSWKDRFPLALKGVDTRWRVGRYGVFLEDFERRAVIPLMERIDDASEIYLDEVGKMELFSETFRTLVERLLISTDGIVVLTIPWIDLDPLVARVRRSADILIELPFDGNAVGLIESHTRRLG